MTMTRPPGAPAAGPGPGAGRGGAGAGRGGPQPGFGLAGFRVRLTAGAYILSMLVVLVGALVLPRLVPGLPAVAYLAATAGLVIGVLVSLTAHELAHAAAARRHGAPATQIPIGFFGGISHARHEFRTARALGFVAAAGPAASLCLAAVSAGAAIGLALLGSWQLAFVVFAALAWLNAMLTLVNALPGAGLDGGRVVHAIAWARSGDRARAAVAAARVGQLTGALLVAGGVALLALGYFDGIWAGLVGMVMAGSSRAQAREAAAVTALAGLRVRDLLSAGGAGAVPGWQSVRSFLDTRRDAGAAPGQAPGAAPGQVRTAFPVAGFDGRAAGLLTLSQVAAVPADRRDSLRVSDVATPVAAVVTTTPDEPVAHLVSRLRIAPSTPAAIHTAGHALVLAADGVPLGVLTPADLARASQSGAANARSPGPP